MKKFLQMFALMVLMAVPIGASATTDTITVADGTTTNSYIPIYGFWADADQHNQIVYPASMLTEMIGQNIIGMNFYMGSSGFGCTGVVRMAIVSDSTLSGLNTSAMMVEVWSGSITSNFNMEFTNAFNYTGGNLLVDIQTVGDSYASTTTYGISRNNASYYSYNGNGGTQNFLPKADFIYSDETFCNAPMGLTFDTSTTSSISIHWIPGGSETMWEVKIGDSIISNVTDTFLTVTNLNASTRYNVQLRSLCNSGDTSSWTGAVLMQTECASIANLPWSCDFEGEANGNTPLCWTLTRPLMFTEYSGDTNAYPYVYNSSYYSHSGSNSLYFYFSNYYGVVSDTAVVATPYFTHNPADLHVSFWMYVDYAPNDVAFQGGIMTNLNDASTFIPLTTVTGEFPDSYTQYEFYTSSLTDFTDGDSACVAFRLISGSASYYYLAIDDVTVDAMGSCLPPVLGSGNVDSLSYESVFLSWEVPSYDGAESDVMLVNQLTNATTHHAATDTTVYIDNLPANTPFAAYAATVCGTDTTNYVHIANFTTHKRCYSVQNPTCVALTANAAALAWTFTGMGIEPSSVDLVLTDNTDTNIAPVYVSVVGASNYTFSNLTENHNYTVTFLTLCGSDDSSAVVSIDFMPHAPACAEVTGTNTSSYVPFYSFYNNGFSESLYDADLLDGVDTIAGITLEVATALNRNNILDIYMGYTSISSLTESNFVPVSQLTHVVTNFSLNTGNTGWTDLIPFDTVFTTQPTGDSLNLVIAFYNHTGSYSSGLVWATHNSPIGSSVYRYTDSDININAPAPDNNTPNAPNIQFYGSCGGGDCLPASPAVSATDTTTATLTWLPGGTESSWIVQYRLSGTTTWVTAGTAIAQPYTITGLNAGSEYQFRLGSDCGDTVVYSAATTGTTVCGIAHAPFAIVPTGENNCWYFYGDGYYSSYSNYYYILNGAYIVTPVLADDVSDLQVKVTGYGVDFYVGACDANGANPEWIDTVSFPNGDYSNTETRKVYLHHYTGTKDHIILRAMNGYNYTYLYNISIEPLDNCMPIEDLTVDSVTTTDAWLSWESDGSNFEILYHAVSDTTNTWITTTSTTNSVHLTGLNSNDRYWIKVFNVCSATERSDSVMLRFNMGCAPFSTPFVENFGFEDLPVCWSAVNGGNVDYGWEYTVTYGYDYIISEADYGVAKANDWLMTPNIQMPANTDNFQLIYYLGGAPDSYSSGSSLASCELRISTTGSGDTSTYTTILRIDTVDTYNSSTWSYDLNDIHVALSAYAGQTVSFAFVNRSYNYGSIYLGDVEVRETVDPVYSIHGDDVIFLGDTGNYYAVYLEGSLDSMNLSWTSTMAAAGHAVMFNGNTDTMQMVYTAEGIDTLTFIAANPYSADTNVMYVYIYNCAPVSTFPFHEGFETENAPAGCWTIVYGDNDPAVNPMVHLAAGGDSYLDSVAEGNRVFRFSSYSSSSDYNQYLISRELNGSNMVLTFKYLKGSYSSSSVDNIRVGYSSTTRDTTSFTWGNWITDISIDSWATFTDTIPDSTKFVAIQYWGNYAYYIYIDDFTITGQSGCTAPVINSIDRGETSLTVNFATDADSVELIIAESQAFNENAASVIATGNSYTFTGLNHSSTYTIGLRAFCDDQNVSEWNIAVDSTLTVNCGIPTGLEVVGTSYNSVTLSWTAAGEEHGWEMMVYNTLDTFNVTSNVTTGTVDGLMASTAYNARVRALCGQNADVEGEWSEPIQVTTDACTPVTDVTVSNVTGNTADVSWTAPEGATNFRVLYGTQGFDQGDEIGSYTISENQYHLTGLEHNTPYTVRVANLCTETLLSQYASADFTTGTEGIANIDSEGNLNIYPNPASSMVTISVSEQLAGATVSIVDLNGRTVNTYSLNGNTVTFDVSTMAKGAYFVRITGEQAATVRKLIVK